MSHWDGLGLKVMVQSGSWVHAEWNEAGTCDLVYSRKGLHYRNRTSFASISQALMSHGEFKPGCSRSDVEMNQYVNHVFTSNILLSSLINIPKHTLIVVTSHLYQSQYFVSPLTFTCMLSCLSERRWSLFYCFISVLVMLFMLNLFLCFFSCWVQSPLLPRVISCSPYSVSWWSCSCAIWGKTSCYYFCHC